MAGEGTRIAVHYPSHWSGRNLVTMFHGLPGFLLAPYTELESLSLLTGHENLVLADGLQPLSACLGGAICVAVGPCPGEGAPDGWFPLEKSDAAGLVELLADRLPGRATATGLATGLEKLGGQVLFLSEAVEHLTEVSIALSAERDHGSLLALILSRAREMADCDAGSLYLVEREPKPLLRFVLAQNDSVTVPFSATEIPLDRASVAGYVALTGEVLNLADAYLLPSEAPYTLNRAFDEKAGYVTRSMLVVPMCNHRGDVTGVLQLINRRRDRAEKILTPDVADKYVIPFEGPVVGLLQAVASMAAVAIDNNTLIQSIQVLFEGFVSASVKAIEQRDPTTSGHSTRVSLLSLGLAQLVDRQDSGPYREVRFTADQQKELRYASILHDFGKVGVREQVLIKAKKLYPGELERVLTRLDTARLCKERELLWQKVALLQAGGGTDKNAKIAELDAELARVLAELDAFRSVVLKANEPTVLPEGEFSTLQDIARLAFVDLAGASRLLLEPEEVSVLSLRKGTLTEEERLEIESHVTHTFQFLSQIPWTPELRGVPAIAYGHHEKLNGRGYPRSLGATDIPIQARMMSVADIFDALSASDRPYKRAVPVDRTLDILRAEAKEGMLETGLVELFIEGKVYESTRHLRLGSG